MQQASTSALQEVAIAIDLGFGIDTKTDPKAVIKTKLLRLENAVISQAGQITKRPGTQSLPNVDFLGNPISQGQSLGVLENELLMVGQGELYAFNKAQGLNFSPKGPLTTVGVNRRIFASNLSNLQSVNAGSSGGVTLYAWDSAVSDSVGWMVVDEVSGTIYQTGSQSAALTPQIVVAGGKLILLIGTSVGFVVARIFTPTAPWQLPSIVSLSGITLTGTMVFGAATDGTATVMVAATNNASGVTVATYAPTTMALIASATIASGFGPPFISVTYFPVVTAGCNWGVYFPDLVGNLKASFFSTNLSTVFNYTPITGTTANPVGPGCMRQSPANSEEIIIYATVYNPQTGAVLQAICGQQIQAFALHISSGVRFPSIFPGDVFMLGAQLASFPWATGVGTVSNILVQYQVDPTIVWNTPAGATSPQSSQSTAFILDADTAVMVGRGPPGQALVAGLSLSGVASYPVLPAAAPLGSNRFLIGQGASLLLESQASKFVFGQGVGELLLDYGLARALFLEKLKSNSHITGGQLDRYDGNTIAEHGFTLAPEFIQVQEATTLSGEVSSLIDIQFTPPTLLMPFSLTTITFPPAAQMAPGDWWAMDDSGAVLGGSGSNLSAAPTKYFWYRINGIGSDPAPIPSGGTVVDILSTDTSLQVAQKTCARISFTIVFSLKSVTIQNGNAVVEFQIATPYPAGGTGLTTIPAIQSGKFRVAETVPAVNGGVSTSSRCYSIACCPGAFISPGQYWQFNLGVGHGIFGTVCCIPYVWYKVSGVGTDPGSEPILSANPGSAVSFGIEVDILSGDTAAQVATKTWNAINLNSNVNPGGTRGAAGTLPASGVTGNFVFLSLTTNSGVAAPDLLVPEIGANVSVGAGALGLGSYNGAGGAVNPSQYGYAGVYAEVDAKGNIHRSAPGEVSVTCPRSPLNDMRLTVTMPNYHLTNKGSNVILELYRTTANGSTFYKTTPSLAPVANNPALLSTTFNDSLQDARPPGDTTSAELTTNEILYTDGGNLQHDVMAPAGAAHVHRGRVWLGAFADDPLRLQTSLLEPQGRGVAFSNDASHTIELTPSGGAFVSFGTLDEKLIIFKQSQIYWTAGDGPDSTGQNGSFLVPELISAEVGCDAPKSILRIPLGLLFKSEKGWFLLGRDLSVTHLEEADGYNNFPVTSGCVDDASEQCRWTTLNGPTICFNYIRNAWSVNDNAGALDSVVYAPQTPGQVATKVYYYVTADGKVHQETPGTYLDDGVGYALLMQTAWIKPGDQVAGFARARKALWLGLWPALQYSTLTIEYNYNEPGGPPATTETMNLTGSQGVWGDGTTWGSDQVWGGTGGQDIYRWRAYVKSQKGTSFRFTLQDIAPFVPSRAVQITNLTLFAGIKKGAAKLGPTTQSIGS